MHADPRLADRSRVHSSGGWIDLHRTDFMQIKWCLRRQATETFVVVGKNSSNRIPNYPSSPS